jgi:hypothetical protein
LDAGVYSRQELAKIKADNKGVDISSVIDDEGNLLIDPNKVNPDNPALSDDQKMLSLIWGTIFLSITIPGLLVLVTIQDSRTAKDTTLPTGRKGNRGLGCQAALSGMI